METNPGAGGGIAKGSLSWHLRYLVLSYSKPTANLTCRRYCTAKVALHKDLFVFVPNGTGSNGALMWPLCHKNSLAPCGTLDTGVMKLPPALSCLTPPPERALWPTCARERPLQASPKQPPDHLPLRPPVRDQ